MVRRLFFFVANACLLTAVIAGRAVPAAGSRQNVAAKVVDAHHLIGLGKVKRHCRGTLDLSAGGITFHSPKGSAHLSTQAIRWFALQPASRALVPGARGTLLKALPFEAGTAFNMIRTDVDVLTIAYRGPEHGLHEAVFFLPKGQGKPLIPVFRSMHVPKEGPPLSSSQTFVKDRDLTDRHFGKVRKGATVVVNEVRAGQADMPPSCRAIIYEEMVARLASSRRFQQILRAGESAPSASVDLLKVHVSGIGFKKGKPRLREVAGFPGDARITAEVKILDRSNHVLRANLLNSFALGHADQFDACRFLGMRIAKLTIKTVR